MKKRNLIFGLLLALLTFFAVNITPQNLAFAADPVTITFKDGGTLLYTKQTDENGKLSELPPSVSKDGYYFLYWEYSNSEVTTNTEFTENSSVFAKYTTRPYTFTISKETDDITTTYKVTEQINETYNNLLVSENNNSLLTAIKSIKNIVPTTYSATINFDNITLTEDLIFSESNEINFNSLTLSGTINLEQNQIKNIAKNSNSTLNLSSLTINSSSNNNLITIDGAKTIVNTQNVTFNCSYNSSDKNNYSIFFNNDFANLNVDDLINYQTTYLYNHKENFSVDFKETFTTSNEKISITFPLSLDGTTILTTHSHNNDKFEFIPLNNTYQFDNTMVNGVYLIINAKFNINFNKEINENYTSLSSRYNTNQQLNYPSTELTKEDFTLNGFAGKITVSETTYYFNKQMLQNYFDNNGTISDAATYFSTTLPTAVENGGFTYYKNDASDINFKAVKFMLDNNQTPEFVALWSETIYTITLNTMGGTYDGNIIISGTHGSSINLESIIPTKTGHVFKGWYTDETCTTEFNLNSMPNTNPTIYAKWQANKHTLTIVLNNGESNVPTQVDYNTPLSNISAFTSLTIEKTGYNFVSWHTAEPFADNNKIDEATFKMPDNDVTLYANWNIKQYTITLYYNHVSNSEIFKTITEDFGTSLNKDNIMTDFLTFEGYEFMGWYKDRAGVEKYNLSYPYLPNTMPSENITLYAKWHAISYTITYYTNQSEPYSLQSYKFGDTINILTAPNITNYKFLGWYTDTNHTKLFNYTTMPSNNIVLYARLDEKQTITISEEKQIYEITSNNGFKINNGLSGFKIQYLIGDDWTTEKPTKKGTYDVKITRSEDNDYKAFSLTIENGLQITPENIDMSIIIVILYCLAGLEILFALILMFVTKQRKTYLTYVVSLPFGAVTNSQFVHFVISLVLTLFGFVLIMLELSKLRKINAEIAKINTEQQDYKPPDVSENKTISKNVEILLKKEGFYSSNDVDIDDDETSQINNKQSSETDTKENSETDNH